MDAVRNLFPESKQAGGLSSAEARSRLKKEGYNELLSTGRRSTLDIVLGVAREPMFLLLIVSISINLALGDLQEALVLSLSLFVIFGITIFQERKTERALEALRDLSSPRALMIRDGEQQRIVGREVVRGDILILTEGDRVPADAVLLSCNDLMVDESLLPGESVPVRKIAWDGGQKATRPGGDDLPFVYSGTMLVLGLIFVNRSRSQNLWRALRLPNRAFWWVVGAALSFLAAVLYIPHLAAVFRFAALDWPNLMIAVGAGWLAVLCLEIVKLARREPST
jgi:magnesium-transporting ATPase (P-type)